MKRLLTLFSFILLLSNWSISQQNCLDSIQTTKIVRLINDFKACNEYSQELEDRLITARELLSRTIEERNEYALLYDEVDEDLKESNERKEKLERKLKRTRRIGLIGTATGFIIGVLVVFL